LATDVAASAVLFSLAVVFRSATKRRAVSSDERAGQFRGRPSDSPDDVSLHVELAALVSLRHAPEVLDQVRDI
jgi:hypothetical protein